jgi:HTH-type transcriptional regulator / antitoxin MqsA
MDRKPETEIAMFNCHVCGHNTAKSELVSEVFNLEGRRVLVENIPAVMCEHCGEATFSRETTERIRKMVRGAGRPVKTVSMDVFAMV